MGEYYPNIESFKDDVLFTDLLFHLSFDICAHPPNPALPALILIYYTHSYSYSYYSYLHYYCPSYCSYYSATVQEVLSSDAGESSKTFCGVLAYMLNHRPKVIIMENLVSAPWESFSADWLDPAGYTAKSVRLDKPSSSDCRTRGAEAISSPLTGWLLVLPAQIRSCKDGPIS